MRLNRYCMPNKHKNHGTISGPDGDYTEPCTCQTLSAEQLNAGLVETSCAKCFEYHGLEKCAKIPPIRSLKKHFAEIDPDNILSTYRYHYNLGVEDASRYHDSFVAKLKRELLEKIEREAYTEHCGIGCEHEYPHEQQVELKTIQSIFWET